jgi:hypothetical protein
MAEKQINIVIGADIAKLEKGFKDAVTVVGASGKKISSEMEAVTKSIEKDFERIANSPNTKRTVAQLQNLALKVQALGPEFQDMANKIIRSAGQIKDKVGDAGDKIKYFSSDTRRLDAVVSAAQGVAGAFGIAEGAAALFGTKNEDLEKALLKVQGAIAIMNGLTAIQNVLKEESAAITGFQALQEEALAIATYASASAMNAFKVALLATGIGLAIVGIGLLISKMMDQAEKTKVALETIKKYRDELNKNTAEAEKNSRTLGIYLKIVKDSNRTDHERIIALREINKLGVATSDINIKSGDSLALLSQRTMDYMEVLKKKAIAESFSNEISDAAKKYSEAKTKALTSGLMAEQLAQINLDKAIRNSYNIGEAQQKLDTEKVKNKKAIADADKILTDVINKQQMAINDLVTAEGKVKSEQDITDENKIKEAALKSEEVAWKNYLVNFKKFNEEVVKISADKNNKLATKSNNLLSADIPSAQLNEAPAEINPVIAAEDKAYKTRLFGLSAFLKTKEGLQLIKDRQAQQAQVAHETKMRETMIKFNEDNLKFTTAINAQLVSIQSDAYANIGLAIADGLMNGGNVLQSVFSIILNSVASFADAYGKALIAAAVASEAFTKLLISNPVLAIGAGIALVAAGAVVRSVANKGVTAFADGGIVSGPTLGLMGEYPGASTNPEVIAPLSKLQGMLAPQGGGFPAFMETRFDGRDLYLAVKKYERDSQRG